MTINNEKNSNKNRTLDNLGPYPTEIYDGVNLNWLILFSVGVVEDCGLDLSFEHIVMAAFKLFPKKFSLLNYQNHPDAKRVHDALWRCSYKNRQWLMGKTSQGFAFTERGHKEYELAKQALQKGYQPKKKTYSLTRRLEKLLVEVRSSPAYKKYQKNERDKVSEAECCHALQGTLDTDHRVLLDNLSRLKEIATGLQQTDLIEFLDWLSQRFDHFLGGSYGNIRHPR